jgi:outer membrane protein OmpA-like peptidoglycan-associated protein
MMRPRTVAFSLLAATVAVGTAACQRSGGTTVSLPDPPPSALVIVPTGPVAGSGAITGAISGSARSGEHAEVAVPGGQVRGFPAAPGSPTMTGPVPPKPPTGPTNYTEHLYHRELTAYDSQLAADRHTLERTLTGRLDSWASGIGGATSQAPAGNGGAADVRTGLSAASGFFLSLQQAGVGLGPRRVVVLLATSAISDAVPLGSNILSGATVIISGFDGSEAQEAEWQADLLQAGAGRAVVLSPGASGELGAVIAQGLNGQAGPPTTQVRFALNQATLSPSARAVLAGLATELIRTCPGAQATILGFADPLGAPARNQVLARERAGNVMTYLEQLHVPADRLYAAGYGASLPEAPASPSGAQPLDRRAVVVIDPPAGQHCALP